MRIRTRANCLSWARFAREHADAGLAAMIAAALVMSLAAFDTAAREAAVSQTVGGSITMPVENRETGCRASKVNTARAPLFFDPMPAPSPALEVKVNTDRPAVDLNVSTKEE